MAKRGQVMLWGSNDRKTIVVSLVLEDTNEDSGTTCQLVLWGDPEKAWDNAEGEVHRWSSESDRIIE